MNMSNRQNPRTRVKICGITDVEMALTAVEHGADAIGLVFYPPSPRDVSVEKAADIVRALPAFVTTVGLFVNEDPKQIRQTVTQTGIDLVQLHGNECPEYCNELGLAYIKAVRMSDDVDLHKLKSDYSSARSLLLDAYKPGVPGGTGESFDWDRVPAELAPEIILAGGLTPQNIEDAINQVHPYAVDVSGGVEAQKGIKSTEKIIHFMQGVKVADQ